MDRIVVIVLLFDPVTGADIQYSLVTSESTDRSKDCAAFLSELVLIFVASSTTKAEDARLVL